MPAGLIALGLVMSFAWLEAAVLERDIAFGRAGGVGKSLQAIHGIGPERTPANLAILGRATRISRPTAKFPAGVVIERDPVERTRPLVGACSD